MNLETYTYRNILNTALAQVPDTVDKSEGSIIYDALAPACYVLAQYYLDLKEIQDMQFIQTSYGEYLDKLTSQFGVVRLEATKAIKKGTFKDSNDEYFNVSIGDRFSTNNTDNLIYTVIEKISDGIYKLECETVGTVGNSYTGEIIPVTYITGLATATLGESLTLARDIESDDSLKERYIALMNEQPFSGNVESYIELAKSISGVGDVQVYPIWNGGGTVKLSLVDTEYNPLTEYVLGEIQTQIDPTQNAGLGYGLAPIGHEVTVSTPEELLINVSAEIIVANDTEISQYQNDIEDSINEYTQEIRSSWGTKVGDSYNKTIYVSQILAKILSVDGVENVTNVQINSSTNDLVLVENGTTQQIPKLGIVTLTEDID